MVTGSHNPPDYNGFKMMIGKKPFYGAQIQEIGRMAGGGRRGAGGGGLATAPWTSRRATPTACWQIGTAAIAS